MDVIFIAGSFPPKHSARAIQNARMVSALGWRGHLIIPRDLRSGAHPHMLDFQLPDGMRIHRLFDIRGHRLHDALGRLGIHTGQSPDAMRLWAMQAGILAATMQRPDLIVTVSHPLSTHLAGLLAKRTTRRSTPWLAYFSDPWVDMDGQGYVSYTSSVRRRNTRLESAVIHQADALVFTNTETRDLLVRRHPDVAGKTHVVSQSFDPRMFPGPEANRQPANPVMVMRYVGDFYGPRSPRAIIAAALALEAESPDSTPPWKIEFYGRMACNDQRSCEEMMARSRTVTALGKVDYARSLDLMITSDVLLVIDAPTEFSPYLPSKLVDYLGARKPILGFTAEGAGATLIRRAGGMVVDVVDVQAVTACLRQTIELWRQGELGRMTPPPEVCREFELPVVAGRFEEIARSLVRRQGDGRVSIDGNGVGDPLVHQE